MSAPYVDPRPGAAPLGRAAAVMLAVALVWAVAGPARSAPEPIKIGLSIALSGRFATIGEYQEKGYRLWERNVNRSGGILGRRVELVIRIMDLTVAGGMGGRLAMEKIRRQDVEVVAIVASGYSDDPVMADFARYGFDGALRKPFDIDALARILEEQLPPPAGSAG